MATAKVRDRWQQLFWGGIKLKGLNGLFELIGGVLLLLVDPNEDPNDGIARFLVHSSGSLTGHAMLFSSIYLLTHGLVKVVLVMAVLKNKLWSYTWMIVVLLAFIAYQLYRIALHSSAGMIASTIFDGIIAASTWREYRIKKGWFSLRCEK
ncbi:DUF2127 domain-containing protein [Corynebacterium glutamicum]|uniref:DUF2127 domain-containing protein n=1 Tax=Corynebacterium glutamicum TaxID=1718 RepID=UPI001C6E50E2|nr:DUF2127 domain-containing protein [Corynebacterium glutamicum]QYR18209.1 DUF2127 domain-containing protein [Corynebacterium glutamicum]